MGSRLSIVLALLAALGLPSVHGQESNTKAAQMSTEAWLMLIDRQDHGASWDTAAGLFK